ncbi:MAG: tRNA uridine-5-carboxymethylaminomethyl(34) synthesis GTPase MnmE [Sphingobacteriales bacterium]|nr:MAG: tRNA uridine-5-carboxymethylaminomethyl(34) synthesis GTPase MnmE [Sphingobacteriales bacterium]
MASKLSGWDDTIVALATAPGIGAIAVIRLSGKESIGIVNELFPSKNLAIVPSHTLHVGYVVLNKVKVDEVVVGIFRGPKSYTGEDVVEVSCHGSPYIQQQLIQAFTAGGARTAKPGEFTQRAFLNGRMDLTQAEAVADLIASNTEASRKTALNNMRGGFSTVLSQLRDRMLSFSALIELELDFSQEDVEFADRGQLYALLDETAATTSQLLQSFQLGNVIKNGVQVAIIGKPNAGKSTLLNTLLNENRAIVSDIAGTTRDTIEEILNIDGILFRLVDTAGIREHTTDIIESIGVEKSLEKMAQADIVVYMFDVTTEEPNALHVIVNDLKKRSIRFVLVGNKSDLAAPAQLQGYKHFENLLLLSAKMNDQVDRLKSTLKQLVLSGDVDTEATIVTNARHFDSLQKIAVSVHEIRSGLDNNIPSDLIALDIRRCLHFLGEITGEITHEDQLDYIFSKFCIGK